MAVERFEVDTTSIKGLQALQGDTMFLGAGSSPSALTSTITPPPVSPSTGLGM